MSVNSSRVNRINASLSSSQSIQASSPISSDTFRPSVSVPGAAPPAVVDRPHGFWPASARRDSSPVTAATPQMLSTGQKTPMRSFYHRSFHGNLGPIDASQRSSQEVREQTAELASIALSDAASGYSSNSPSKANHGDASSNIDSLLDDHNIHDNDSSQVSTETPRPEPILELSEPTSPDELPATGQTRSPGTSAPTSALTEMLRASPPEPKDWDPHSQRPQDVGDWEQVPTVLVDDPAVVEDNEETRLISKQQSNGAHPVPSTYGTVGDVEAGSMSKPATRRANLQRKYQRARESFDGITRVVLHPKSWNRRAIWKQGVVYPASLLPAVFLGLLLNILDALSYGMILFPLGEPLFADLGSDGISMFYISCIVSQLVYSCGGSIFKGGIGSEMIEVVPFFHKMAFMILNRVGKDNEKAVLATTILSYAISSVLTGAVFFLMGLCRLGALIGFFPRHILIGCIGGVGWFLVATGVEVSARLSGNLEYNIQTLKQLFQADTVFLWAVPLVLAIILMIAKRWVHSNFLVGGYFIAVACIFYFFKFALRFNVEVLRQKGWVFDAPEAGNPWYHFYELYDFSAVNWKALAETIPSMFALTFFGVLHVPINVPALGISTGEDNLNVDRELMAHGVSNALSGFFGSIQNYLVYTNSLLFIDSGGNHRLAGILLAAATFGILLVGPAIIGYIPIMIVGALIFMLGIELMEEALVDTWGKLHRLEYLTVVIIVVTMGAWDFVIGIFVGIILACVNYVVQTSRKSAIRATYTGDIAGSTVRRHPIQHRFLREAGKQTHVIKLAGFLFFGTIVSVENRIRALLEDDVFKARPIRFLVVDFNHVYGLDFSAAEAFTRINRIVQKRGVQLILSGLDTNTEIGRSLHNVGLLGEEDDVQTFEDLNSALEYCENELLKALYQRRETLTRRIGRAEVLDVPNIPNVSPPHPTIPVDTMFSSPRHHYLHQVATTTLEQEDAVPPAKWQNFIQPLPLILQTFQDLTDKNEDFWFRIVPYFVRKEYSAGTVLYHEGDKPNGFYVLEDGILRAEYDEPQGRYYESIVAGTTCGELPFFSATRRTATVVAERNCVAWLLDVESWEKLRVKEPDVAQELLMIGLKLTVERMTTVTRYVLTTAG